MVLDEAAQFLTETEGPQALQEILRAIVPSLAQFQEHGRLLITSTPRYASGPFYEIYRRGESGADSDVFVAQSSTWEVNPRITRAELDEEFLADPEGAAQEYGAEWVSGMGAYLDAVKVYQSVIAGRSMLPPVPGVGYVAAADPAFARGGDQFGFAIMHRENDRLVLDLLKAWRGKDGPLNSDTVLDEIAALCKSYGIGGVISDQFSAVPIADGLRRRDVTMIYQPLDVKRKLDIMSSLKQSLNLGKVELLDGDPSTLNELVHLELRTTPGGNPKIQAASGYHDDRAMVIATAIHELSAGYDPARAQWLGSKGKALADEWVDLYGKKADERAKELIEERQVTVKVTSRQQAEAAMRRAA